MWVRVFACVLASAAASSSLLAQQDFDSGVVLNSDEHFPAARRTGPTVEIPTASDAAVESSLRADPVVEIDPNAPDPIELALGPDPHAPASAWLDLRQADSTNATQTAPQWVKAITTSAVAPENGGPAKTIFHIELERPSREYANLLFRVFFEDKADAQPEVIARSASGEEISHSGVLGAGVDLPSSESVVIPMEEVAALDVVVADEGESVRAAYLDWMKSGDGMQPANEQDRHVIAESFGAMPALRADEADAEKFGTVTATLSDETIRLGSAVEEGAAFQFGVERQPLVALLTFEVVNPRIDAPPDIYLNGHNLGAVTLMLPELADPAYRGEMPGLVGQMQFRYTGWIRAQKIVPATELKAGDNQLIIANAAGTDSAAIRATQIQLKYLWEKSDYVLRPVR